MSDVSSLKDTIIAKSSQMNADDLLSGPKTVTVTAVRRSSSPDQPVDVHYEGDDGKPYKPCKSMRKVLIFAWGENGADWIGRSMTLFNDPEVKFGGIKVGGIRISHLSHIERDIAISLTATKGKKAPITIKKLASAKREAPSAKQEESKPAMTQEEINTIKRFLMAEAKNGMDALKKAWSETSEQHRLAVSPDGTCPGALKTAAQEADNAAKAAQASDEF